MSRLRRLIAEIHRRSLWQVLGIYLAGSWVALQVVGQITTTLKLPSWVPPLAFVLLLIGLPVVLATAFVQEGGPLSDERSDGATHPGPRPVGEGAAGAGPGREEGGGALESLFTWRHAIAGGLLAFALLGLVVTGWFLYRTDFGSRPLLEPAATEPPVGLVAGEDSAGRRPPADTAGEVTEDLAATSDAAGTAAPRDTGGGGPPGAGDPGADPGPLAARTGGGDRERRADSDGGAGEARTGYRESRDAAEEALRSAVEAGARLVGDDLLSAGDSLSNAAVAVADAGRYGEATATMERARRAYERARRVARDVWLARLDSVKEEVRTLLSRRALDSTAEEYARAEQLRRQAAELESFGRYPEAVQYLHRTVTAIQRVPTVEADSLPAAYELSPREVVEATLERIAHAIEAEDLEALREVWSSLSGEQAAGFRQFFEQARDLSVDYTIRDGSVVVGEDRVVARVETVWRYYDEADRSRKEQRDEHRFEFELRGGSWVVTGS